MTFQNSARSAVLDAASSLETKSREIGIFRSVDATESSRWLQEVAKQLREACLEAEPDMVSPPGAEEAMAPHDGAVIQLAAHALRISYNNEDLDDEQRDAIKHDVVRARREYDRLRQERDAALSVVRAVYQESKAIHAAYKALPEHLREEVERPGTALRCRLHGGYGFQSDCGECREG